MDLQKQYPCDISPFYDDSRELYIPERGQHCISSFLDYSISFIVLFCFVFFSPQKLVRLFPLKKVKPPPDR